jgi:hypothetical protein
MRNNVTDLKDMAELIVTMTECAFLACREYKFNWCVLIDDFEFNLDRVRLNVRTKNGGYDFSMSESVVLYSQAICRESWKVVFAQRLQVNVELMRRTIDNAHSTS